MMKYIIQSESFFDKNEETLKIIRDRNFEKENIYTFDYTENELDRAKEEFLSNSFFGTPKLIILNNCVFLEKNLTKDLNSKLNNLLNSNIENTIILKTNKLDTKNLSFFKKDKKFNLIIKKQLSKTDLTNLISLKLNQIYGNVNRSLVFKFLSYLNYDYDLAVNEIKKFELTKSLFTDTNIDLIIYDFVGQNIFKLYDAILNKNLFFTYEILKNFKQKNTSPVLIIEYLIKELQLIQQLKHYQRLLSSQQTKIDELNLNHYRLLKLKKVASSKNKASIDYLVNSFLDLLVFLKKENSFILSYDIFIAKIISIMISDF